MWPIWWWIILFQFAADIYNKIFETPEAVSALKKAAPDMEIVVEAYRMATSTPPLDTSREWKKSTFYYENLPKFNYGQTMAEKKLWKPCGW